MNFAAHRTAAVVMLTAIVLGGCSTPENYFERRMYDAADMVDFKYGCDGMSGIVAAKVAITNYLGWGLGYGNASGITEQWGRRAKTSDIEFLHIFVYGFDGSHENNVPGPYTEWSILGINCCQENRPPWVGRFRVGGEVLLAGLAAGIYLNTGEIVDFVGGIFTWDPAGDDDMAWGTDW